MGNGSLHGGGNVVAHAREAEDACGFAGQRFFLDASLIVKQAADGCGHLLGSYIQGFARRLRAIAVVELRRLVPAPIEDGVGGARRGGLQVGNQMVEVLGYACAHSGDAE